MCSREIFNPNIPNRRSDCIAEGLPEPPADTDDVLARSNWFNEQALPQLERECDTHYGYKIIDASLSRQADIAGLALSDPAMKIIVMSRNPLATFISNCVCMVDNIWDRTLEDGPIASPMPQFSMRHMDEWVTRTVAFWQMVTHMSCAKAIVTYTDLVLDYHGQMQQLCQWLGGEWPGTPKPLSRTRPEMVKDRLPNMSQVWPIAPAFWARDMYEVLSEEPHDLGPHI